MTKSEQGRTRTDEELAARFVGRAQEELRAATLDQLLAFLTVRRLAPGSALARFYEAFPKDDPEPNGRDALIKRLKDEATSAPEASVTSEVVVELLALQNALTNRDDEAGDKLRTIAQQNFDAYAYAQGQRANEVMRNLMVAVAPGDDDAREHLTTLYEALTDTYTGAYKQFLTALARQPIPELGSVENFGRVIAALLDGLLVRAAFDEPKRVHQLLRASIVPLVGALTYSAGDEAPTDRDHLYDVPPPSATIRFSQTPPNVHPVTGPALDDLRGTWQGTMQTRQVLRSLQGGRGPRETYLVLDDSTGRLEASNFIEGGFSRMVMPEFFEVGGARRMVCVYEAELRERLQPQSPSHRGAWILEAEGQPAQRLTATYFNDRSTRGEFRFTQRVETYANNFDEAQAMFKPWTSEEGGE